MRHPSPEAEPNHVSLLRARRAVPSSSQQPRILPSMREDDHVGAGFPNAHKQASLAPSTIRCTVPACTRPFCALRSHRQYSGLVLRQKQKKEQRLKAKGIRQRASVAGDGWSHLLLPSFEIGRDGVDGFPFMPIPDQLDPGLRSLFHHFFANVFDRLVPIFRAPPIAKDFKPRMLQVALTTPSYCLALIAQSQIDMHIGRDQFSEDRESLALYGKVIEVYRKHLIVMQPAHIDVLLLVIVILLTYDLIHDRRQSALIHWNGMQQLVSFRGGIHNIGVSLAYVVHADRVVATFNNKPPAYPLPADRSIQLMRPSKSIYGSAFISSPALVVPGLLTPRTQDYCVDTVRLVELFESTEMSFDPARTAGSRLRDAEYFYFSRDRLDGQFPILNAELHDQTTKEYCIILAARIAEYPITWTKYVPTLTAFLVDRLREVLKQDDMLSAWIGHLNVLSWILFVASIALLAPDKRAWLLDALARTISAKYGFKGCMPDVQVDNWKVMEWSNARTFVWSDIHMRGRFDKVCDELEASWGVVKAVKSEYDTSKVVS